MYKLCSDKNSVIRLEDGACIPLDPFNVDAQEFAGWLWSGEKPEPAEEGGDYVSDEWIDDLLNKFGYKDGVGG
jgi:hypothetical protein